MRRSYHLVTRTIAIPRRSYTSSGLLQPQPRRSDQRYIHRRHQRQALFIEQVAAREDGQWEDIGDQRSKQLQMYARRLQLLEDEHATLQREFRHAIQALDSLADRTERIHRKPRTAPRRRLAFVSDSNSKAKKEAMQKEIIAELVQKLTLTLSPDVNKAMLASMQDIAWHQEAIERKIEVISGRIEHRTQSLHSVAMQKVRQVSKSLGRTMSRLYRCLTDVSEPGTDAPRPTKGEMCVAAISAATLFTYTHPQGFWVRELFYSLQQALPSLHEFLNAPEFLGLFIHTSSLPLILATRAGTRKAFRSLKKSSTFKGFFDARQRRRLSTSSPAPGSRKETSFRNLVDNHPELLDRPFPMAAVLNDLRNLQALRGPTSGREYKVAERRLFRVQHESELGEGAPLTVRQVTQLLQPDDSVGWTAICQRLLEDRVDAIDSLSKADRARVVLQRVYGIGATKAERFVQAGFLTLEQLREACLEKAQRIGLTHMDDIECLIPRSESEQWREILLDVFRSVDPQLGAELLGSFRRGDYFSSDLDWVLYHPDVVDVRIPRKDNPAKRDAHPKAKSLMQATVDELQRRHLLADELLAHGPVAVKGLVRLPTPGAKARRIDLNFAPFVRRAFYTLAKTGDADLMVHLRARAKDRGWALNEYGIGPSNPNGSAWTHNVLDATDEKQIFDLLKVPYLEPEQRSFSLYAKKLNIVRS